MWPNLFRSSKSTAPKRPKHVLDASRMMGGEIVAGENVRIDHPWWETQDKLLVSAVAAGWITQTQADRAVARYYPQPDGQLLCIRMLTDGSGLVVGTSIPEGKWRLV